MAPALRAACALWLALFCAAAVAQTYPSKPVRLIVTFPPGASSDVVGRMLGQKLGEFLGAPVVPDHRAGAGRNLVLAMAAKTPPDGYTIGTPEQLGELLRTEIVRNESIARSAGLSKQ